MMMAADQAQSGWVTKESRTHKGNFYSYNPSTGESRWLDPNTNATKAPPAGAAAGGGAAAAKSRPALNTKSLAGATISPTKGSGRRPLSRSSRATVVSWGTDDTDGGSECICTICECGKHACPIHKYQPSAFTGNSRYREDYPIHPLKPRDRSKLAKMAELTPADPDHFKSKYADDFRDFVPEPPMSLKPKAAPPQHVPFEGTTTNREMHDAKPIEARPYKRPLSPAKHVSPFEGTTSHRDMFRAYPDARPRESMAPVQRSVPASNFDGLTQYKQDYIEHPLDNERHKRPEPAPWDYGPRRDLETEQRAAFTPKEIHYCPVLDLERKDPSQHTGHVHYTKQLQDTTGARYFPAKASPAKANHH